VIAQGQGEMAKLIIEAARAYGVPIVRDVPVARALNELEVGDEIPEVLYEAVAEILREIWQAETNPAPDRG
jgi:type III secretion system FlhB-like substrate exporter